MMGPQPMMPMPGMPYHMGMSMPMSSIPSAAPAPAMGIKASLCCLEPPCSYQGGSTAQGEPIAILAGQSIQRTWTEHEVANWLLTNNRKEKL